MRHVMKVLEGGSNDPLHVLQRCSVSNAVSSATNLSTHRRISVDKMCYCVARFGRQKVAVNREYGHDTQAVRVRS